jgi:hypothetical protein
MEFANKEDNGTNSEQSFEGVVGSVTDAVSKCSDSTELAQGDTSRGVPDKPLINLHKRYLMSQTGSVDGIPRT